MRLFHILYIARSYYFIPYVKEAYKIDWTMNQQQQLFQLVKDVYWFFGSLRSLNILIKFHIITYRIARFNLQIFFFIVIPTLFTDYTCHLFKHTLFSMIISHVVYIQCYILYIQYDGIYGYQNFDNHFMHFFQIVR